jgi:hypothetical protein
MGGVGKSRAKKYAHFLVDTEKKIKKIFANLGLSALA